jgi:hypothetical protein
MEQRIQWSNCTPFEASLINLSEQPKPSKPSKQSEKSEKSEQ